MANEMGADKAAQLARKFLEDNYGNITLLLYRIENVEKNTKENMYKVLCSILPNVGASERIFYFLKIDISKEGIEEASSGKIEKDENGRDVIVLHNIPIKQK